MQKAPKIGQRVSFAGNRAVGQCTGRIVRIHVEYDDKWDDEGNLIKHGDPLDESQWTTAVQFDAKPEPWAYGERNVFAARVHELREVEPS